MKPSERHPRPVLALLTLAAAPLAVLVAYAISRGHLPAHIPHSPSLFTALDSPRRPESLVARQTSITVISLVVIMALYMKGFRADKGDQWLFGAVGFQWIGSAMTVATLLASMGAPSYDAAVDRWWAFPLGVVVAGLGIASATRLIQRPLVTASDQPIPESSLHLQDSERAVWTGSARSTVSLALGVVLLLVATVMLFLWPSGALLGFVGFACADQSRLHVRIDSHGVHVRSRWSRWGTRPVALQTIASADETQHLSAWEDYQRIDHEASDPRVTQRRIRRGAALSLNMHSGRTHSISVDHADQAADVLNAMVARARQGERSDADVVPSTQTSDLGGDQRR